MSVLLISEKILKANGLINNNVDNLYLYPAIEYSQDAGLQPLLGSKLYRKIKELVENGSISEETDYKSLLDDYIIPYLLNKVTADIQIMLAYKFRNQGIVQNTGENTYQPSLKDLQYVTQSFQDKANFYANRMSDYLKANKSKYPEYSSTDSCADMKSNKDSFSTGIYLGV